jgi:protein involved in polysaccharide export with SLBB domain
MRTARARLGLPGLLTALLIGAVGPAPGARAQAVGGAISGDRVDVIEREAPESLPGETTKVPPPFGSNLFRGGFRAAREDGFNPTYVVQPGDEILLRIWGATNLEATTVVDAQGNIFVPDVGPIRVAGVRNSELTNFISRAIARVFTSNINVYTNVAGTTPVIVYTTGYVRSPGSYAGVASDSMLFFLDRAGGVDPVTGSFRDIRVLRGEKVIARADLYRFLLYGEIPKIQFEDGDTILVGRRGSSVSVQGAVRNRYTFEILPSGLTGAVLTTLASPQADASHVALKGSRSDGPVSAYLPLAEFAGLDLRDGDVIVFEADEREDTMLVRVEGSHLGPSRFAVPRDATLYQLLDHIEVDPRLADIQSVSLQRRSIKERQEKALADTLRRLEAATLAATSQTDAESQIRANEAKLIADFVERAKKVKPDGVLVVAVDGRIRDIQLQPEDIVTIPERNDVVMVGGEVAVPQAVVYEPGNAVDDYIARVGGYTNRADRSQLLVVRRSGEVLRNKRSDVRPGDEIMVLPEVPAKGLEIGKTIIQAIFQIAVTTGIFLGI